MKAVSPFDHRPDKTLGRALRELLSPADHQAFVADVVAAARRQMVGAASPSPWDILSAWMRPGLVAAAVLVLAAFAGIRGGASAEYLTIDEELTAVQTAEERAMFLTPTPPDVDIVLVSVYEN